MSKKISALTEITTLAAEDILPLVDFGASKTKGISGENFLGNISIDLATSKSIFQNEPFSYAGKRIEIISPYVEKDQEYQGQLHFHSTGSDGVDTPAAIVTAYEAAGYDFVSLTDHDVRTADPAVAGVLFIHGVEETSDEGHITSTNPTAALADTPAQDIIDALIADGAFSGMAHPNNAIVALKWTDEELEGIGEYFSIEVFNGQAGIVASAEDKWDTLLSKHIRAFGTAADDCHDLAGAHFDEGWVQVFADSLTTANIMDSLKRGNYYSSTGPTISISVSKKVVTVTADSAATIAFIGNGGATLQTTAAVVTASYTIVGDEVYVRAKVTRDSDSTIAWSNPIYVYLMSSGPVAFANLVRGNEYVRGDLTIDDDVVGGGSAQFVNIGVGEEASDNAGIYIDKTFTEPGTTQYGLQSVVTFEPSANNTVVPKGDSVFVQTEGAFDFTGTLSGASRSVRHGGTGDIANAAVTQAGIQLEHNTGTITDSRVYEILSPTWVDGNKTIGSNYGLYIRNQGHANITTSYGLRIANQTASATAYSIYTTGGQILFDQSNNAAAIPVLALDQADLSEGFIDYLGTSAASAVGPITSWTTGNTIQGFVRVEINGAAFWMPYYDAPTS